MSEVGFRTPPPENTSLISPMYELRLGQLEAQVEQLLEIIERMEEDAKTRQAQYR